MANQKNFSATKVIIPCRISFANIWEAKSINGGEEKYSVSCVIPKSDKKTIAKIQKAVEAAKEDGKTRKWSGKIPPNLKLPLRDGDIDRPDDENYQDCYFLNATSKDAPQVVDPALWDERGKALMEQLAADEFYQSEGLKYSAKDGCPYMIAVNRAASTVTVLALDDEGNYTKPYMAMVCSGGADTPLGFFATPVNYDWRLLAGPSYGQYATRIWDSYLFHTVPYYSQHKDDIEYDQFNQLGTQASLGCIRLLVCDVKWIYDNCPIGTRVVIYDNADDPGPMGKPGTIYTDPADESKRGWDPTDPDSANPWDAAFRSGTAIRSEAAWNEWNDAQNDGRWNGSINPTDLQGWSTDSSVEGTRG